MHLVPGQASNDLEFCRANSATPSVKRTFGLWLPRFARRAYKLRTQQPYPAAAGLYALRSKYTLAVDHSSDGRWAV